MSDKIDIHNINKAYSTAFSNLKLNDNLHPINKQLILQFLWDCELGKTIKNKAKKKVGKSRLLKYIFLLQRISYLLNKPFDQVNQIDMETFIYNLENNIFKSTRTYEVKEGYSVKKVYKDYSEESKLDYKKTIKKFYKWLLGKNKYYPELVEFIDTSSVKRDIPAFTREEVERLIDSTPDIWKKALLIILFDGGLRIEELLNVRLKDITKKIYDNNECYWVDIRYSKTEPRTIPLPLSTKHIDFWLKSHPEKGNIEAVLFPFRYDNVRTHIQRLCLKVLNKNITLHQLRHSSATYWANKMEHFKFCVKYGWSMSSRSPDRYIKRKGIIFESMAEAGDTDKISKLEKENKKLWEELEVLKNSIRDFYNKRACKDKILTELFQDDDFDKMFLKFAKEKGYIVKN